MSVDPATAAAASAAVAAAAETAAASASGAAGAAPSGAAGAVGMDVVNGPLNAKTSGSLVDLALQNSGAPPQAPKPHSTIQHYQQSNGVAHTADPSRDASLDSALFGPLHHGPSATNETASGRLPGDQFRPEISGPESPGWRVRDGPNDKRFFGPKPSPDERANSTPDPADKGNPSRADAPTPDARASTPSPIASPTGVDPGGRRNDDRPSEGGAPFRVPPGTRHHSGTSLPSPPAFNRPPDNYGSWLISSPFLDEPAAADDAWMDQIRAFMRGSSDRNDKRAFVEAYSLIPGLGDWADAILLVDDIIYGDVSPEGVAATALPGVTRGNLRAAKKLYRTKLRKYEATAKLEKWARSQLVEVRRRLKRDYSMPNIRRKVGRHERDVVYDTDNGPVATYATLRRRTAGKGGDELQAHHMVPQSLFWNGALEKAGLADYVPGWLLTKAEHDLMHSALNATLKAAGVWGKSSYTDKEVAKAIRVTAEFYRGNNLDWAAQAVEQFAEQVYKKVQ